MEMSTIYGLNIYFLNQVVTEENCLFNFILSKKRNPNYTNYYERYWFFTYIILRLKSLLYILFISNNKCIAIDQMINSIKILTKKYCLHIIQFVIICTLI